MCRPKHWQIHKELLPNSAALQNFLDFLRSLNCFTTLPFCSHQLCSQQQQKVVFTQKERPETWLQMMLLCPCWICLLTCVVKFFCPQVAQIAAFKKKCWNSLSFTKKGKFNHYLVTHMLIANLSITISICGTSRDRNPWERLQWQVDWTPRNALWIKRRATSLALTLSVTKRRPTNKVDQPKSMRFRCPQHNIS